MIRVENGNGRMLVCELDLTSAVEFIQNKYNLLGIRAVGKGYLILFNGV